MVIIRLQHETVKTKVKIINEVHQYEMINIFSTVVDLIIKT